nr:thiamine diphosphokinase [Maliibacterium massiliense]
MKALLVVGGPDPGRALIQRQAQGAEMVICADRGAQYALGAGVTPQVLIGDMDSIAPDALASCQRAGTQIIQQRPDKDFTDTELALLHAEELGAQNIVLLGGLGGRIDHTLSNLRLLLPFARRNVRITMMDPASAIFVATRTVTWRAPVGTTVSMFPLSEGVKVLRTQGLAYPLSDKTLPMDTSLCVSNVMQEARALVDVRDGYLMIMVLQVND